MNKKVLILLAVVWTAAIGLVGFSELRPEGSSEPAREAASTGSAETAETNAAGKESGEQASSGRQTAGDPEGVTLQLGGEPGLEFAGRCVVDGEERELGGQTPEVYNYEPEVRLECEISSSDHGSLRVTFSDGEGTNTVQQIGPQPGTVELSYTGDSLSTSTSSVTRTSGSQKSSSQVSSSQSSQTSSSQMSGSQVSSSQHSSQSSSVVSSGSE